MKVFAGTFLGACVACSATPHYFKPLVDACAGLEELKDCKAHFEGICKTDGEERFCGHDHEHEHDGDHAHSLWHGAFRMKHYLMGKMGFHGHHHPRYLGDCGDKADGEKCSHTREGRCVDSGKCPIFQGEMVCKPWDAHPPKFITEPCEGKAEHNRCYLALMPGACVKSKTETALVCKAWSFSHAVTHITDALTKVQQAEEKPAFVV